MIGLAMLVAGGLTMLMTSGVAAVVPVTLGGDPPSATERAEAMNCRLRRLPLSRASDAAPIYRFTISIDARRGAVRANGVVDGAVIALRFKISRRTERALVAHTPPTHGRRPVAFVYRKHDGQLTLGPLKVGGQSWALAGECISAE